MDKHDLIADAAEIIDTLTSNLPADHPLRASACNRAKRIVGALYEFADEVRDGGSYVGRNQAPAIRALLAERDALRKFVEDKMHHLPIADQHAASLLVDAQEQS